MWWVLSDSDSERFFVLVFVCFLQLKIFLLFYTDLNLIYECLYAWQWVRVRCFGG